jgi:beta-RFAP synthase
MTQNVPPRLKVISAPPVASATVTVPARLHLGFLDLNGGLGRKFGGIGLAIDGFSTSLTIRHAPRMQVEGADKDRARAHVDAMNRHLVLDDNYHIEVRQSVPPHAGLGSGTGIALAAAAAVRALHGLKPDPQHDAAILGRGARSGLGIAAFAGGGLAIDGGRGAATQAPPVIVRTWFPEEWRVLLVLDARFQGLHGTDERAAFANLPPFPAEAAAHLCRLVLMKALPAAAEHDLASFGAAISEMQERLGDYYSPAQGGGRFTSAAVGDVLALLAREGAHGIGQSSWGPTGFAFAPSARAAEHLARMAGQEPAAKGLDIRICKGLNRGAEIMTQPAAAAESDK